MSASGGTGSPGLPVTREASSAHPYFPGATGGLAPDAVARAVRDAGCMAEHTSPSSELGHVRVGDCMHHGILSCAADTPLGEVAGVMARHHVHMVAVTNSRLDRPRGLVSALDVVAAAAAGEEPTALQAAATEPLGVSADESLERAAQLMSEHGVSHLVVLDASNGHPVGVLSTIDIAAVYASAAPLMSSPARRSAGM